MSRRKAKNMSTPQWAMVRPRALHRRGDTTLGRQRHQWMHESHREHEISGGQFQFFSPPTPPQDARGRFFLFFFLFLLSSPQTDTLLSRLCQAIAAQLAPARHTVGMMKGMPRS